MRLVTILLVGAALLVPSTAGADSRRFTDRHHVKGLLDIADAEAGPRPGSVFRGWENGIWCRETRPDCTVPMGELSPGDKSVTASFGPPPPPPS